MAGKKWTGTKFKGVRFYEHATRKHGVKFDRYFAIRYQKDGRRIEEGIGWTSERDPEDGQNWTEAKAALVLERLRGAARHGKAEAPTRIAEQREIERQRKEADKEAQALTEAESVTFGQYFENHYFPAFEVGRKNQTTRKAKEHFKNWIEPAIGQIPLKDIKPFAIEKIKKNVLGADKAPRTLQYIFATIRQTWNHARRNGRVSGDSPTKSVKVPKIDNRRVRFLSHKEAGSLLSALKDAERRTHDLALVSLHTGLRFGEIAALKWSHLDTKNGIISIMDPKGVMSRAAFMTEQVKALFEDMERRGPNDYVFTKQDGGQLKLAPKIFAETVEALGLNEGITDRRQRVCFHTLRHTYASWHAMAGTEIYTLKELLGHSVIAMTERYSHLAPGTLQNATRTLEQAIASAAKETTAEAGQQVANQK